MPTTSVMGGVPASNLAGSSAVVNPSRRTSAIMLPPPRNGGIASSSASRPHSTPTPEGPHSLWLLNAMKSAPHACTSVTLCGTYWQPSTMASAPASWAAAHSCWTGVMVPSTLLIAVKLNTLAPSSSWGSVGEVELAVGGERHPAQHDARSATSMCHGTMLAWCSMCVSTHDVAGLQVGATPRRSATRFSASVAFLVNTISCERRALMNCCTLVRAPSYASVASAASGTRCG
jgi:hypothetical protein